MLRLDNGPSAKICIFQQVMRYWVLMCEPIYHRERTAGAMARSKGKVERSFRTVKEMHETLYHFHEPQDET
jgi:hypothetical protein